MWSGFLLAFVCLSVVVSGQFFPSLGPVVPPLQVDESNDCRLVLRGVGEHLMFRPTAISYGDEPVFQAFDETTCEAYSLFVYRWYNFGYDAHEWNVDDNLDLSGSSSEGGRLGYIVPDFRGCPKDISGRMVALWHSGAHHTDYTIESRASDVCGATGDMIVPDSTAGGAATPVGIALGAAFGAVAVIGVGGYGAMNYFSEKSVPEFEFDMVSGIKAEDHQTEEILATEEFV